VVVYFVLDLINITFFELTRYWLLNC